MPWSSWGRGRDDELLSVVDAVLDWRSSRWRQWLGCVAAAPLSRRTVVKQSPLRADPAKVAAFVQRNRKPLARTMSLKRGTPRQRVSTPPDVWREVLRRDGGLCVWSAHLGRRARAEHPHHLLPKGKGGWPQFFDVRENIVGLAPTPHMAHEHSPLDRLPWEALPGECQAFLLEVAAVDPRAERLIECQYPVAGEQRQHPVRRSE